MPPPPRPYSSCYLIDTYIHWPSQVGEGSSRGAAHTLLIIPD